MHVPRVIHMLVRTLAAYPTQQASRTGFIAIIMQPFTIHSLRKMQRQQPAYHDDERARLFSIAMISIHRVLFNSFTWSAHHYQQHHAHEKSLQVQLTESLTLR